MTQDLPLAREERKLRLKINALKNLMFNIHESISSLGFTKLFQ